MQNKDHQSPSQDGFDEKVIQVSRVSKKTKGGNKMGFSVLMVVGDKKGQVGVGLGKAHDVVSAMRKGSKKAKKNLLKVPMNGTTIPFAVFAKLGAGKVLLKPAPRGSGVIAGGPVRAVVEAAGIRDISSKIMGSENQSSSVYATFEALRQIGQLVKIKGISLRSIADVEAEQDRKREEAQQKAREVSQAAQAAAKAAQSVAKPAQPKPVAKKIIKIAQPAVKVVKAQPVAEVKPIAKTKPAVIPAQDLAKKPVKKTTKTS